MDVGHGIMGVFFRPSVGEASTLAESIAFTMVPMSYFFVFAATSGLISVVKDAYGEMFSVILMSTYFLPGLPCSLLQQRFDIDYDLEHTSFVMFQVRMITCFMVLVGCAIMLIVSRDRVILILVIAIAGVATWSAHGTCTQLVQLRAQGMIQVQLGGGLSNVLALVLVMAMQATAYDLHDAQIDYYYLIVAFVLALGCLAWLLLLRCTDETGARLHIRDARLLALKSEAEDGPLLPRSGDADATSIESTRSMPEGLENMPEEDAKSYKKAIRQLRAAMFINVFVSSLMGNFFVYVPDDSISKIATFLVFTRLFSLTLSRLIAYIYRPPYCSNAEHLLWDSSLRAASISVFFLYIGGLFKADWFIILYVVVVSFLAGTSSTFAYVVSREICLELPQQYQEEAFAQTSYYMNIAFNSGGFTAAIMSMIVAIIIRYVF